MDITNKNDLKFLFMCLAIGLLVAFLICFTYWGNWHIQEGRFLAAQPIVALTTSEKTSLVDAAAKWSMQDRKPHDQWIEKLAQQKRWGLLPALPEGYRNDWVELAQKRPVLLPKRDVK